jgi:GNAT superfamily N-acetyltransferase
VPKPNPRPSPVRLRRGRVGDLGWMFHRQAVVYHREFGYLPVFETYLAQGLAPFLEGFDPALDRVWVAERDGQALGFIAIQHDAQRKGWAKLRWFLVEREARGLGLGRRLMQAALRFARDAGYRGISLWTVDDLADARRVYERSGFVLAEQTDGCAWAPWGREQRWELRLS